MFSGKEKKVCFILFWKVSVCSCHMFCYKYFQFVLIEIKVQKRYLEIYFQNSWPIKKDLVIVLILWNTWLKVNVFSWLKIEVVMITNWGARRPQNTFGWWLIIINWGGLHSLPLYREYVNGDPQAVDGHLGNLIKVRKLYRGK